MNSVAPKGLAVPPRHAHHLIWESRWTTVWYQRTFVRPPYCDMVSMYYIFLKETKSILLKRIKMKYYHDFVFVICFRWIPHFLLFLRNHWTKEPIWHEAASSVEPEVKTRFVTIDDETVIFYLLKFWNCIRFFLINFIVLKH